MKYFLVSYFGQKTQGMILYTTDEIFFVPSIFMSDAERRTKDIAIVIVGYREISKEHHDYIVKVENEKNEKMEVPQGK